MRKIEFGQAYSKDLLKRIQGNLFCIFRVLFHFLWILEVYTNFWNFKMKNKIRENEWRMNSVRAALGPRPQPTGSAQPAAMQPGRPTARRGAARVSGGHRARPGQGGVTGRSSRVVLEWYSWRGELKGDLGIAPGKEIRATVHPSGRSTSRRWHSAQWWHSSAVSDFGGSGVLVRWASELLHGLL
jgi:hypothetical protein